MTIFTNTKEAEVYSTTSFKDVIASPAFFAILFITFVLGISSIFGFLQNPLKLKAAVDVISKKVSLSSPLNSGIKRSMYSLSNEMSNRNLDSLYIDDVFISSSKQQLEGGLRRIAFNYDITSKQFWSDLDTSRLDSALEESARLDNTSTIGTPLESDFYQQNNDSMYSMKIVRIPGNL